MRQCLPIDAYLPEIGKRLQSDVNLVIVAEPGAGKTTRVPSFLLDASDLKGRILVLQPRRVAVRSTARRVAKERQVNLGELVGYRVRFERHISDRTRLEFVTEGLFLRELQRNPFLDGIAAVVFDEFHERSLNSDLTIAMCREVQLALRPDLRLVVMSATLDAQAIATWLDASILNIPGRTFPVELQYAPKAANEPLPVHMANTLRAAHRRATGGDILAFLPGVADIQNTAERLVGLSGAEVIPLHGRLDAKAQDKVYDRTDLRRIILATNIAETSLTIPNVSVVIDSGLEKVNRFDPAIGMERLELTRISQASATQRAGRAGRTGPGQCIRLWSENIQHSLSPFLEPEIRRADLTSAALQILSWGSTLADFEWFEAPLDSAIAQASHTLRLIGATDGDTLSEIGRILANLPIHPRVGRILVSATKHGQRQLGARIAALISERDILHSVPDIHTDCDLEMRLDIMQRHKPGISGVNSAALRTIHKVAKQLEDLSEGYQAASQPSRKPIRAAQHVLTGFPDRVALRRGPTSDRLRLANGHGARLHPTSSVRDAPLLIAVRLRGSKRGQRAEHIVDMASALAIDDLELTTHIECFFDEDSQKVVQREVSRYLNLELKSRAMSVESSSEQVSRILAEVASTRPEEAFAIGQNEPASHYLTRLRWLNRVRPDLNLPSFGELTSPGKPTSFIEALCLGKRSFAQLRKSDLLKAMQDTLGYTGHSTLNQLAPKEIDLPDGSSRPLTYRIAEPPILSTRFERLFGLADTPRVGQTPIVLELLAPNKRPVQTTSDLRNFWLETYPQIRKELRGRYPKHPWPDDPLTAKAGFYRRRREKK